MYNRNTDYKSLCKRLEELEELVERMRKDNDEILSNLDNGNLSTGLYNDISLAKSFASKGEDGRVALTVDSISAGGVTVMGEGGTLKIALDDSGRPHLEFYNAEGTQTADLYSNALISKMYYQGNEIVVNSDVDFNGSVSGI